MEKADRLRFGQTMMTHAMLFTRLMWWMKTRRWRVENSGVLKRWGEGVLHDER